MTKRIVGKVKRLEGSQTRLFTIIECDICGKQSFERKPKLILHKLEKPCSCLSPRYKDGKRTGTYISWLSMRERCSDPFNKNYNNYGGRGIKVCPEWDVSFEKFYLDMGERPDNTTIDRIEHNEGYYPGNCRWATPKQQAENKRVSSQVLNAKGYTMTKGGKFFVRIYIDGKDKSLGVFDNEKDARLAYLNARRLKYS